ncbi:klebicin D activity protein, partial [Serratia marcescens]
MPQELNGHGPTAGDYMGGSGDNLNARPDGSTPGGSNGNGGRDSSISGNSREAAKQRQVNAIKNDPSVKSILGSLLKIRRALAPYASVSLTGLDDSGRLQVQVSDVRAVDEIGVRNALKSEPQLKNVIGFDFNKSGVTGFVGHIDTGHKIGNYQSAPNGNSNGNNSTAEDKVSLATYSEVLNGKLPPGFWLDNNRMMTEI